MTIVKVDVYLVRPAGLHPVLAEIITDAGLRASARPPSPTATAPPPPPAW